MDNERLNIWISFWKWFLSSVVITGGIAWATTIINAKHQETELSIKINQQEKEYLTSFLEKALDDNLEKRYRFAQYFAYVTSSPEYRGGWRNYFEEIERERNDLKSEKVSLEDAIGSKSGEELNQAKRRLRELQSELEYTKRKNSKTNLITNGLDNAEALLSTTLKCPEGAMKGIWVEAVWYGSLPDFPAKQNYVTLGCKDKNGLEKGRFISWYPNGQVVSKGLAEGEQTFYYPNGNKAAEAGSIGDQFVESKRLWALDGKEIER